MLDLLQSLAANLFASSIFPYAAFLYYLTRSKKTPGLALFGFYFLLVFVFATIPAGIYGDNSSFKCLHFVQCLQANNSWPCIASTPADLFLQFAAKTHYGTILANVDWLHGGAESLLTITNLMIGV